MRWIIHSGVPDIERMLLVESGPRTDAQRLVPLLRQSICRDAPIDLFTCLPDSPSGLGSDSRVWRTNRATRHSERWKMLRALRRERHGAAAILCCDSPVLGIWKIVLATLLPAKILLVEDGSTFFWMDRGNWRKALQLAVSRSGIGDPAFIRRLAHLAILPFGLCILLAFAAKVHFRRLLRATRVTQRNEGAR